MASDNVGIRELWTTMNAKLTQSTTVSKGTVLETRRSKILVRATLKIADPEVSVRSGGRTGVATIACGTTFRHSGGMKLLRFAVVRIAFAALATALTAFARTGDLSHAGIPR